MASFDYQTAFSRNIGWVTRDEQEKLRNQRIAIAGMGGVGGVYLLTLTRLGIGNFNLSDFDTFELGNFNRQAGAALSTLGRPKLEVMAESALDINPTLNIRQFPSGISADNVDEFLHDVDLYVDGLDFFVLDARRAVYQACAERGIPVVVAAPLGMGVSNINYLPGGMPLNRYFDFRDGLSETELAIRFLVGLSPAVLQARYLADTSAVRFKEKKGPSTPMACELCAGVAGTAALKILLGRGKVISAPDSFHFDAYLNKAVHVRRPGGNRNPLQRLALAIARRRFGKFS
ncbi:ThiF family adenylyltransferase [Thiohalobacter sp.]|uniref:ThiF family adenylyltransferase n=1 Tax=Thiohalobacter sp. TaxID=2025948 RepID=UPI002638A272|nr:ThiF family adenylyltransferase [Thiohalobacter sp.]